LLDIFLALALLLAGIFLGKFVAYILKRINKATDVKEQVSPSFVRLIITVIKWVVYIIFINLALKQLPFPFLGNFFSKILLIIPAFVGALILIGIGFAIAIYLRGIIEDSEITDWKALSQYLYYFILYVFGVYAINLALIAIDEIVRNCITVSLTIIMVVALTYIIAKKEIAKH